MTTINLPSPFALDLERHISVPEAAKFKNISPDTFKRHYKHLIRKISPRRNAVKVRDLLATARRRKSRVWVDAFAFVAGAGGKARRIYTRQHFGFETRPRHQFTGQHWT